MALQILITNDDGILAPGLSALVRAASAFGDLHIVAPATAQSATAHSITLMQPIMCQQVELPGGMVGYSVEGRPADCVKLAITELMPVQPDLILSGINAGGNFGVNVLYSGTVAAAIEGALYKIPSIAFSLTIHEKIDFDYAQRNAQQVMEMLLANDVLDEPCVLNVNIPACEIGQPKGVKVVRQTTQAWADRFERRIDPRGRLYFWFDGEFVDGDDIEEDTDAKAVKHGYISITTLNADLTDHAHLAHLQEKLDQGT